MRSMRDQFALAYLLAWRSCACLFDSEYLAEENPVFFWQFVELLKLQTAAIADKSADVDALAEFAVQEALKVAPASKNVRRYMCSISYLMHVVVCADVGSFVCVCRSFFI